MAKQNFLGGGYTGKLGATIGQRWKNAYTVRTYTKPTNPQTPAQQANRGAFGGAVFFAQLGNQMNYKSPAFDTANNTEWAYRMSAAKINIQNSLTDLAIIPIVPQNFTTSPTVSGISLKNIVANTSIEFELTLSSGVGAKSYSLMLYFAEGSREGEYLLLRGATTAAEPTKLICPCVNTATIGQVEVYALIVSTDDTVAETIAYSARVPLVNASKPAFAQTVTITRVDSDDNGGFAVTAQMGVYGADLVGNFTNGGVIAFGQYKTKAAVFAAGDRVAAAGVTALGINWQVSNWSVNNTTGVITFTAKASNFQEIDCYDFDSFRIALAWENAYNSQTEMSSGSCQAATSMLPVFTQPAFNTANQVDNLFISNWWTEDEDTQLSFTWEFTDGDFTDAMDSMPHTAQTNPFPKLVSGGTITLQGAESGTMTMNPRWQNFDWNSNDRPYASIDGYLGGSQYPEQELTSGSIVATTWRIVMGNNIQFGAYDNNHRWTACPDMSASGSIDIW